MNVDFWIILLGPAAALMMFFFLQDRYEPEPWWLVLRVCRSARRRAYRRSSCELIGQTALQHYGHDPMQRTDILALTFFVVFCEELVKFLTIYVTIYRHPEYDEVLDGITYGVAAALGFASVENLLYIGVAATRSPLEGFSTGVLRALLAVPAHALFGAIMGHFMDVPDLRRPKKSRDLLTALGVALALHGTYDFILYWAETPSGACRDGGLQHPRLDGADVVRRAVSDSDRTVLVAFPSRGP